MKLQILIPCWNHWEATAKCLASIFNSKINFDFKVLVYNNNSTDLTAKFLTHVAHENYPIVAVHNMKENLGFVEAVNALLPLVDSDYVLLMNNDVILDKDCIKNLVETIQKNSDFGILGGMQYDINWMQQHPVKNFVRGSTATIDHHIMMSDVSPNNMDSDYILCDDVHMACAVTPTSILKKFKLDPIYGLGNYDQEQYCLDVKQAGYKVAICPKAKYIHFGAITSSDMFITMQDLLNKNRKIFWKRWGEKLRQNLI